MMYSTMVNKQKYRAQNPAPIQKMLFRAKRVNTMSAMNDTSTVLNTGRHQAFGCVASSVNGL